MPIKHTATETPERQAERNDTIIPSAAGQSVYFPEKSRTELLIVAGVFTVSCLYFLLFYNYTTLNPVEGIVLQGAQRILDGEVLYRDFFSFYTPGSFYWMALLFKVFGDSILVARAALMVYGGMFSALTYLLARRACSRGTVLLTVYMLTLVCLPYVFFPMHNWDSTLWALLALYFAVRFLEAPHWGFALAVGVFVSLTCLFEQSKGAGLVLGLALGFGAIILTQRTRNHSRQWAVGSRQRLFPSPTPSEASPGPTNTNPSTERAEGALECGSASGRLLPAESEGGSSAAALQGAARSGQQQTHDIFAQGDNNKAPDGAWEGPRPLDLGLSLGAFLAGFTLPALITVAYFAAQHSLPQMLADCLWPLRHSGAVRNPYGFMELSENVLAGPWSTRLAFVVLFSPCFIILALPIGAAGVLGFWLLRLSRPQRSGNQDPMEEEKRCNTEETEKNSPQRTQRSRRRGSEYFSLCAPWWTFFSRDEPSSVASYYVLVSATLVGLLLATLASRPDFIHVLVQAPLFFLVLAWGLDSSLFKSKLAQDIQTLLKYYVFLAFTGFGLVLLGGPLHAHTVLGTRRGALRAARLDPVLQELQVRVRPGQNIFVYPFQPLYYYLTSTVNPTRHDFLHLGMHTPQQFAEAMRELAADRTPMILVQPSFSDVVALSWPATPTKVLAEKDPLMEYILANYRACTARTALQSWQMVFMVRKELRCTGPL